MAGIYEVKLGSIADQRYDERLLAGIEGEIERALVSLPSLRDEEAGLSGAIRKGRAKQGDHNRHVSVCENIATLERQIDEWNRQARIIEARIEVRRKYMDDGAQDYLDSEEAQAKLREVEALLKAQEIAATDKTIPDPTPEQQAAYDRRAAFQEMAQYIDGLILEGRVTGIHVDLYFRDGGTVRWNYALGKDKAAND